PYTRYLVRGFIESSKGLEVSITRYNKDINTIMNVPNDVITIQSYEQTENTTTQVLPNSIRSQNSCTCEITTLPAICQDPHAFSFFIDTGDLHYNENLGISIGFKISNPDGYATLGNVEIIEGQPLVDQEIKYVTEKENKWKQINKQQQIETEQTYSEAQQAVNNLFLNGPSSMLQFQTTQLDIIKADNLINQIPYVYNAWVPNEPGVNYNLFMNLKNQISQAHALYTNRNIIQNGNFMNDTTNWFTSPDVNIQQTDDGSVLVLTNWSAQASQTIQLQSNHRYVLRVIAKKEGGGTGYVKISDCTNQIQKLEFHTYSNCDACTDFPDYVTKDIIITPNMNQIRLDIGETEGVFKIRSIELICS
ncbi:pesticidial crystal protein, partial [Bacillus mycoides]|uniref:pesticidial crystal protein n=1 Tax=Bacillus mycoides TaxID=1405 RepID=UPI003D01E277